MSRPLEKLLRHCLLTLALTSTAAIAAVTINKTAMVLVTLREGARTVEDMGHPAVLVVSPVIRPWLSKAVRYRVNDLTLLSYSEIPDDQTVKVVHTVHAETR